MVDLIKKDSKWKCTIGQTVEVKKPHRIRGLGDNISSAGLIYQRLLKFYPDYPDDKFDNSKDHEVTDTDL